MFRARLTGTVGPPRSTPSGPHLVGHIALVFTPEVEIQACSGEHRYRFALSRATRAGIL